MLVFRDLLVVDDSHLMFVLQYGGTPLHLAAANNSKDVAELLIRSGADINARDEVTSTVIIQVSYY